MAATVMTVEFGTIHHDSSTSGGKFWCLFVQFFEQPTKINLYVNYDISVKKKDMF